ncbi:Fumarate reductase flavoprotein subunit [uncultured Eubacteriales bacterium]|uniref:Urocanate reductase n=1 Tax=uncultured Eubacteriales bacterium TaxID=172733 RepID=A0A212KD85_9FIRM|nr:Fumarate reductase flavoprotein subunit [uncultured Eubacteriales bacterium]
MMKRFSALFLAMVMMFTLAACSGGPGGNTPAAGKFTPGTYEGAAEGFHGTVKVAVTLSVDKIEKVEILEQSETEGIGAAALAGDKLPQSVVDSQSVAIDGVAGATVTSTAFIAAVTAALEKAGVDVATLTPVVGGADETAGDQTLECDVVIVGAGGAGLTAAITAAQAGKSVIILEKMSMAGGNSVRSTGGMNAAKTPEQDANEFNESASVEKTLEAAAAYPDLADLAAAVQQQYDDYKANPIGYFDSVELFMLDTLIGGKDINDNDLVKALADGSAPAIEWLKTVGADLTSVGSFGGASVKRIHRPLNAEGKVVSVGSYLVPILEQAAVDNQVQIIYDAPVTEILTDASGTAVGVKAEGYTVNAKAVVIASGGFGANLDMVAELNPNLKGFVTTNAPGITGDGIKMAEAVGAATVDMNQIQIHPTVEQKTSALITEGLRGDGAILVNAEGLRFTDEVGTRDAVSAAELTQTGGYAWLIVDQAMVDASSVIAGYIKAGYTVQGDTYETLAAVMEVPVDALVSTMETWNASVAAKKDDAFGRTSFANPLDTAPFYAIKIAPGVHHTMGGLKIDTSAQVLKADGTAIPGLFAAGEVTGGIHGANRLGGNAVADFIVFGRISGQSAADYVK